VSVKVKASQTQQTEK